jgi:ABC-type transport system substrate-binding protein
MVPPGAHSYLNFPELYPYDPDRAKRLLREAGFDERTPLLYVPPSPQDDPRRFSRGATSSISNLRDVCSKPWSSGSCVVVST